MMGGLMLQTMAYAIPADPAPRHFVQPDGTVVTVQQWGDERANGYRTMDGYLLAVNPEGWMCYADWKEGIAVPSEMVAHDTGIRAVAESHYLSRKQKADFKAIRQSAAQNSPLRVMARAGGQTTYPTKGKRKSIAILVDFPGTTDNGVSFTIPEPRKMFDDMLNKVGFDYEGTLGSVHDYFLESSSGQFDLSFDVFGPVTMSKDISFYGKSTPQGDIYAWNMVVEACKALDSQIDFSKYDLDKNGTIDNVYIFYAGEGEATGGASFTVWPHAADIENLTDETFVFDGVRLNHYACSNEIFVNKTEHGTDVKMEGIGTVCHEFTHILGFPDLYDTKDNGSFTPGEWSVMDRGSHNNNRRTPPLFSSYERWCMGWIEPRVLKDAENITLDVINKNQACMIPTKSEDEFFLLENRQQNGWDQYIPGHGMIVWHICYVQDMWDANQVNIFPDRQLIDLEEADNRIGDDNRAGDSFPGTAGITSFTEQTTPGSNTLSGEGTGIAITDIKEQGKLITFKVNGGTPEIDGVEALPATEVTPISFVANWQTTALKDACYLLSVYEKQASSRTYVDGYMDKELTQNSCLVKGLKAETTYYYEIRVRAADGSKSAPSNVQKVTTGVMSFEYSSPEVLEATRIEKSSFQANWKALAEASGYELSVFQHGKGVADTLVVDFTGGIKSMPFGWRTNCKMTVSMAGYYGEKAPALSMVDDYSYLESPVLDKPVRGISFWYRLRNRPSDDNFIVISGQVGNEWKELTTFPLRVEGNEKGRIAVWSDVDSENSIFPANCKAVRITFRLQGKGALAIDDVKLAYDDKPYPIFLPQWENRPVGDVTSFVVEGLEPATEYYYFVRGTNGQKVTRHSKECKVITSGGSSIDLTGRNSVRIVVEDRTVLLTDLPVNDGCQVRVYDYKGGLVAQTEVLDHQVQLVMPDSGIYLFAVGTYNWKVLVR